MASKRKPKLKRVLLIDADVYAYHAAAACEVATDWGDGFWTWHCNEAEVWRHFWKNIDQTVANLRGDEYRLCLTDHGANWRNAVLPTYKGNRKETKRPLILQHIKDTLVEEHGAFRRPGLEGDDLMGIFSTWPNNREERIIVSIDKDMKTIPGKVCLNPLDPKPVIREITPEEADHYHLKQTLSGDLTDGYQGCPNVGLERAEEIIREGVLKVPYQHTMIRGPRKGEEETRYNLVTGHENLWEVVVSHYLANGKTEEDALQQARVARILRHSDYNHTKKEPILWSPP